MQFQGTYDVPHDVCANILRKSKLKMLVGDDVLDRFLIQYMPDVNVEEMLHCLVLKKRLQSLILYITKQREKVHCVSTQCIRSLLELSIKQRTFTISIVLCKTFTHKLDDVGYKVVKCVVNGYLKAWRGKVSEEQRHCIVCKSHKAFLEYFICLCRINGVRPERLVRRCDFTQWLAHKHSHTVVDILLQAGCLSHIFEALAEDATDKYSIRTINAIIGSSNVDVLDAMVVKGYQVVVCDVIVGIAMANYEMLQYLFKSFKPRWYSKKFHGTLLSMAFKRDDIRIYRLVKAKLEG